MFSKPFWKSKVFWFNVLAVLVFVADMFGFAGFEPDPTVIALVAAIMNILLRFFTSQAVFVRRARFDQRTPRG